MCLQMFVIISRHVSRLSLAQSSRVPEVVKQDYMRFVGAFVAAMFTLPVAAFAQDGPVVIRADTVLDGKGATLTNTGIVVQGSRIVRIDPAAQGVTYDLRGLTVMPGWIDTHAHIVQHFDRKTGKTPARGSETPQQAALYAVEHAY